MFFLKLVVRSVALLCFAICFAQYKTDSLLQVVNKTTDKPTLLKLYSLLAKQSGQTGDNANFEKYTQKMVGLATELKDIEQQHFAYYYQSKIADLHNEVPKATELLNRVEKYALAYKKYALLSLVYRNKSNKARKQGNFDEAIALATKTLQLPEQDDDVLSKAWSFMANVYIMKGEYNQAAECLNKAYPYIQRLNSPTSTYLFNEQMGTLYLQLQQPAKARSFYEENLQTAQKTQNKSNQSYSWSNLGLTYLKDKNADKALTCFQKAVELDKQMGRDEYMHIHLTNIASAYFQQNKLDEALNTFAQAKEISLKRKNLESINNINTSMAVIYTQQEQYEKAIALSLENKELCKKLNRKEDLLKIETVLATNYEKIGKHELAYEAYRNISVLRDTLYQEKSLQQTQELQTKYETAKKEQEIAILSKNNRIKDLEYLQLSNEKKAQEQAAEILDFKQENEIKQLKISELQKINDNIQKARKIENLAKINQAKDLELERKQLALVNKNLEVQRQYFFMAGIIGLACVLGIMGYLFYSRNRLQMKNKTMALEQKLLRSQMNPHFIFNSLTTIQNYLFENEPQKTASYLSKFAKLMRQTLENSREETISLSKEIQLLENYLQLQELRFTGKFSWQIETAPNMNTEEIQIPPMFAQPFIENSLEHGILHKSTMGFIKISFAVENNKLLLTVTDNGGGLIQSQQLRSDFKKEYKSLATQITQERLNLLSEKYHQTFEMLIKELINENNLVTGTQVLISLPYQS
jgi:tetratricopeptide (TPR) repeat protein